MNIPEKWRALAHAWKQEKPSINWDHVSPEYKYLFINRYDNAFLAGTKPIIKNDALTGTGDIFTYADSFSSFEPGNCNSRDSLVTRPGVEE